MDMSQFARLLKARRKKYHQGYQDEVLLPDGTSVLVRPVKPQDKGLFGPGFKRLSPQSRFLRFHGGKEDLSQKEIDYFTELDGRNHFAIGAVSKDEKGKEMGLGVARFFRLPEDPAVGEVGIVILDEYQRRGLGTLLLGRLIEAALERDIEQLRFSVLPENTGMRRLLSRFSPINDETFDGEELLIKLNLKQCL